MRKSPEMNGLKEGAGGGGGGGVESVISFSKTSACAEREKGGDQY